LLYYYSIVSIQMVSIGLWNEGWNSIVKYLQLISSRIIIRWLQRIRNRSWNR